MNIAQKYGKLPHQVVLRWGIERGFVIIPKSSKKEHIQSNIEIGDFKLLPEEVE